MHTEDDIPVRTLYIPNISIHLTNPNLCNHFRQFGAIERVQILPERLNILDLIPPLDPRLLSNNLSTTKYFAYITFVNPLGACEALQSEVHVIRDEEVTVEQAYSWHQPLSDIMAARAAPSCSSNENEETAKLKAKIFEGMDRTLNDDCISKIMTFVNIFELMKMASYNQRFSCIARQQRSIRILPHMASYQLTMMHLRQILRLHGFGHSALNLTISLAAFKYTHANHHLINKLVRYIGPQLRSFSLQSFNISTSQFIKLKPIMIDLTFLQIDVDYEFDYEQFNDVWPNLQTLRIRSSGVIEVLKRTSTKTTSFPKLTKLIIISNYKLYAHLFETIAINFKGLKELVVINDDYYTEMNSTPIQIDFSFISRMENLTKLHLSFGQNHHNDQIWEILSTVKSLEHLTLNVTSHRGNDNRVTISDRSLCLLGMGLESLKELRICGFALTDEKVIQIIRYAKKLDSLTIYNCGAVISPALIGNIVRVREAQLSKRQWPGTRSGGGLAAPDKVLNLIVELFADSGEEVKKKLNETRIKDYLDVIVSAHKHDINEPYGVGVAPSRAIMRGSYRRMPAAGFAEFPRELNRIRNHLFFFRPW